MTIVIQELNEMADWKEKRKKKQQTKPNNNKKHRSRNNYSLSNFHNELAHTCTPAGKQEQIIALQPT